MIYTLADITVKRFMEAMYEGKKEGIDNWEELFTLYVDTSGIGNMRQLALLTTIHNLEIRLFIIDTFISLQTEAFNTFGEPYEPAFIIVKKYGHRILWNAAEPDQFEIRLNQIAAKEKRKVSELNKVRKEFDDLQKTGIVKEDKDSRKDFIRLLNRISEKVKVDRERDDMETISLMIKDYLEEIEAINQKHAA